MTNNEIRNKTSLNKSRVRLAVNVANNAIKINMMHFGVDDNVKYVYVKM